ncbi:hypothetical protein RYX36_011016, partial [Vicia faba]
RHKYQIYSSSTFFSPPNRNVAATTTTLLWRLKETEKLLLISLFPNSNALFHFVKKPELVMLVLEEHLYHKLNLSQQSSTLLSSPRNCPFGKLRGNLQRIMMFRFVLDAWWILPMEVMSQNSPKSVFGILYDALDSNKNNASMEIERDCKVIVDIAVSKFKRVISLLEKTKTGHARFGRSPLPQTQPEPTIFNAAFLPKKLPIWEITQKPITNSDVSFHTRCTVNAPYGGNVPKFP